MAKLDHTVNHDNAAQEFIPIPVGWYKAVIVESDVQNSKDELGKVVSLIYQIIDHPHFANRKIWQYLLFDHKLKNNDDNKAKAVKITREKIDALCVACHISNGKSGLDTTDFHKIPLEVNVGVEESETGKYGPKNIIKGCRPIKSIKETQRQYQQPVETEKPVETEQPERKKQSWEPQESWE